MAPALTLWRRQSDPVGGTSKPEDWNWRSVASDEDLVIESWSQGFLVGALVIMACLTVVNMRRGVLLHKLILAEQLFALSHGTFCFMNWKGYGWYLSSTAALLYISYILHNYVAWLKVRPFFHGRSTIFSPAVTKWTTRIYLGTWLCTIPPILFQITDNFRYFNGGHGWYVPVRPYEPLMRDPWWIFCCAVLFYVISKSYGMGVINIVRRSPRFGILFVSIILAVIFTALDIVCSIDSFIGSTDGINPFWKLSLVFKCLTDAILLDDFKTELRRLGLKRVQRDEKRRQSHALFLDDDDTLDSGDEARANHSMANGHADGYMNGNMYNDPFPTRKPVEDGTEDAQEVEFGQALHMSTSDRSSSRKSSNGREQVSRGGVKASKLPSLFSAINRKSNKSKANDDTLDNDIAPKQKSEKGKERWRDRHLHTSDEITFEDDHLEQARRMNENTIAELSRRKASTAAAQGSGSEDDIHPLESHDYDSAKRNRQRRRKQSTRFFDDLDDLEKV